MNTRTGRIGIYDSGVGGLSVLRALRRELPQEAMLYVADQAHVPYGGKTLDEIRRFAEGVTRFFRARDVKLIVIACNTASAAALHELRAAFPDVPFVGMEPAVKPAAEQTESGVVGVLATEATFQGKLFESVVERFAEGVRVLRQPCPGLVEMIERGATHGGGAELETALRGWIEPMKAQGIDRLVLGCTHYPLVRDVIERVAGEGVTVIDPAPAIARQTRRVLEENGALAPDESAISPATEFFTTGDADAFQKQIAMHLGITAAPVGVGRDDGGVLSVRG